MTEKDTIRVISEGKPSVLFPKKCGSSEMRHGHRFLLSEKLVSAQFPNSPFNTVCITLKRIIKILACRVFVVLDFTFKRRM